MDPTPCVQATGPGRHTGTDLHPRWRSRPGPWRYIGRRRCRSHLPTESHGHVVRKCWCQVMKLIKMANVTIFYGWLWLIMVDYGWLKFNVWRISGELCDLCYLRKIKNGQKVVRKLGAAPTDQWSKKTPLHWPMVILPIAPERITMAQQTLPKTFAQKTNFRCSFIPKISPVFDDLPWFSYCPPVN